MKIAFDERALDDLENIHAWISEGRPDTAMTVVRRLYAAIEQLAVFPKIGRVGAVAGTRDWVVPRLPYVIVYKLDPAAELLIVVAVFHSAQAR